MPYYAILNENNAVVQVAASLARANLLAAGSRVVEVSDIPLVGSVIGSDERVAAPKTSYADDERVHRVYRGRFLRQKDLAALGLVKYGSGIEERGLKILEAIDQGVILKNADATVPVERKILMNINSSLEADDEFAEAIDSLGADPRSKMLVVDLSQADVPRLPLANAVLLEALDTSYRSYQSRS